MPPSAGSNFPLLIEPDQENIPLQQSYLNGSQISVASSSSSESVDSVESDGVSEILMSEDFSHRPSYSDAALALRQLKRGKATGCTPALYVRAWLQSLLFWWGCFIQQHWGQVLFVGSIILCLFCIGLKGVVIETNIEKLWVEKGGRLDEELSFMRDITLLNSADMSTVSYQVVIQTPLRGRGADILTKADLLAHVEIMRNVTEMEVDMFGVKWRLEDICFKPSPPALSEELAFLFNVLEKIMPCVIITPLDCFWEGSKPLGPVHPVQIPKDIADLADIPHELTWQNLNPDKILAEADGYFDIMDVKGMFERAGISTAFQYKNCLDPYDPNCPKTALNYRHNETLRFGDLLSHGCQGYAKNLMEWPENLIIGGISKRGSTIYRAEALQSVIMLSPPSTVHRRFDETSLKENLYRHDWTLEAAEQLLLAWQRNFSQLIHHSPFNVDQSLREQYFKSHDKLVAPEEPRVTTVSSPTVPPTTTTTLASVMSILFNSSSVNVNESFVEKRRAVRSVENSEANVHSSYDDFNSILKRRSGISPMFHPLAATSVNDMLSEFSKFKIDVILYGYCLMLIYAAVSLLSCKARGVHSAVGLSMVGCLLVTIATAAGLGCSTILGIQFNAATTQIVPFLTLGLGVDDMFLLVYNYQDLNRLTNKHELGYLLKETGLSVMLTSVNNILAFLTGSLLPVPALRSFCLQVAILLVFNFLAIMSMYPAMMSIDLIRRRSKRVDILCCIKVNKDKIRPTQNTNRNNCLTIESSRERDKSTTKLLDGPTPYRPMINDSSSPPSPLLQHKGTSPVITNGTGPCHDLGHSISRLSSRSKKGRFTCHKLTLHHVVKHIYAPFLTRLPVKVAVILTFLVVLGVGVIGVTRIQLGLEMTDIVPKGTAPYDFLSAREEYFSFYSMSAVVRGDFDYAFQQKLLHDYRFALSQVPYVVQQHEHQGGGVFWLAVMRDWVINLQQKYNYAMQVGQINTTTKRLNCYNHNNRREFKAVDDAVLAYKLMVNVGDRIDLSRIGSKQLVSSSGIIDPDIFYNCLAAWYHLDTIGIYVSQANLLPIPNAHWHYNKGHCGNLTEEDMKIPPAAPLQFSQIPFFLDRLTDTPHIVDMITQMRTICEKFASDGLPNFPEGIPFTFWDHYVLLKRNLLICLSLITASVFIVVTLILMSPWVAAVIVSVLVMVVVELAGLMGILGLKLNPVSSVTLITAVGIGVEFTVHMCFSYLTSLGSRNERMIATLDHMFIPVLHGGLSTLLGVIMLAFSEFEFIVRYFFVVMAALIVIGLFNGLVFLPVFLSLVGPRSEVRPTDGSRYLAPPTPPPRQQKHNRQQQPVPPPVEVPADPSCPPHTCQYLHPNCVCGGVYNAGWRNGRRRNSEISLSTITEEPATPPSSVTPPVGPGPVQVVIHSKPVKGSCSSISPDSPISFTAKAGIRTVSISPPVQPEAFEDSRNRRLSGGPAGSMQAKRRRWSSSGTTHGGQPSDPLPPDPDAGGENFRPVSCNGARTSPVSLRYNCAVTPSPSVLCKYTSSNSLPVVSMEAETNANVVTTF